MSTALPSSTPPHFLHYPLAYEHDRFDRVQGRCDACGLVRDLRYAGAMSGPGRPDYVCAWCVADGTAAERLGVELNDRSWIEGVPEEAFVSERVGHVGPVDVDEARTVAYRTPAYVSWQGSRWPSHCGRPCAFTGHVGAHDLLPHLAEPDLAADVDGVVGHDREFVLGYLEAEGDMAGYLFTCLVCGAHRLHVDVI